jgi:hypothetical protein
MICAIVFVVAAATTSCCGADPSFFAAMARTASNIQPKDFEHDHWMLRMPPY